MITALLSVRISDLMLLQPSLFHVMSYASDTELQFHVCKSQSFQFPNVVVTRGFFRSITFLQKLVIVCSPSRSQERHGIRDTLVKFSYSTYKTRRRRMGLVNLLIFFLQI